MQGLKMSKQRRTKIEIIRDILELVLKKGVANKTEIAHGTNLNFERTSRILKWLIDNGLVKTGYDRYELTARGEEILREIYKLAALYSSSTSLPSKEDNALKEEEPYSPRNSNPDPVIII